MTRIKICGLTREEDVALASELGADLLGFIAATESPRWVSPERFAVLRRIAPPSLPCVAVARTLADTLPYQPDRAQFYESSSADDERFVPVEHRIRAVPLRDESSLNELASASVSAGTLLLDSYHQSKLGGSGARFDWSLAVLARKRTTLPLFLAGGLSPENVIEALKMVHPDGVDVASGVESAPGIKDASRLRAFIEAVRAWDKTQ